MAVVTTGSGEVQQDGQGSIVGSVEVLKHDQGTYPQLSDYAPEFRGNSSDGKVTTVFLLRLKHSQSKAVKFCFCAGVLRNICDVLYEIKDEAERTGLCNLLGP